jgi:hypothetical protein
MRRTISALALVVAAGTLSACGEELPTEVGAGLLPGGTVSSIEVVLDPSRFLVSDTAFSGFGAPSGVAFTVIADRLQGVLNSNVLARFQPIPRSITVRDAAGTGTRPDTIPILQGGRLVLRIDTMRSTAPAGGAPLRLYRVAEEWDRATANWQMRVDSPGTQRPWAQPGGTRGALVSQAVWTGGDSVVFAVDTVTLRSWSDTLDLGRGALVVAEGAGTRLVSPGLALRFDMRSPLQPDTVVVLAQEVTSRTFVYNPSPALTAGQPLVGGTPGWRTFMQLRDRLDTLSVPCPGQPGCMMRLGDASISRASLLLDRVPAPPGFALEDTLRIVATTVLVSDRVPLVRSPLGETVGLSRETESPQRPTGTAEVAITELVRRLARAPEAGVDRQTPFLALLALTDGQTFGNAAFAPGARLRLIITVGQETQLR